MRVLRVAWLNGSRIWSNWKLIREDTLDKAWIIFDGSPSFFLFLLLFLIVGFSNAWSLSQRERKVIHAIVIYSLPDKRAIWIIIKYYICVHVKIYEILLNGMPRPLIFIVILNEAETVPNKFFHLHYRL